MVLYLWGIWWVWLRVSWQRRIDLHGSLARRASIADPDEPFTRVATGCDRRVSEALLGSAQSEECVGLRPFRVSAVEGVWW